MDGRRTALLLYAWALWTLAAGRCPVGCFCEQDLIVCTCGERGAADSLRLGGFDGIDYISRVIVHNCAEVTVAAGSFAGLSIGSELSVTDVRLLRLEPFAFREMIRYPKRMHFKNVRLDAMPADAFAGTNDVSELLFDNATVGVIRAHAFRHVSNVDYLYLYNSRVDHVEASAFGQMTAVKHVFVRRGATNIGNVADHIFLNSSVGEVVLEGARIGALHPLAFSGFDAVDKLQMINCSVQAVDESAPRFVRQASSNALVFSFIRTNFAAATSTLFSDVHSATVDNCRIERLSPAEYPLRNVTILRFKMSLVNYMEQRSVHTANDVGTIAFENSAIDTILPDAFGAAKVDNLLILATRLTKIDEHAFRDAAIDRIYVEGSTIEASIRHYAFSGLHSATFHFISSSVERMHKHAFARLTANDFSLDGCVVKQLDDLALEMLTVGEQLNISGNSFGNALSTRSIAGAIAGRLLFSQNHFPCHCGESYADFLNLLSAPPQLGAWQFDSNYCTFQTATNTTTTRTAQTFQRRCLPPNSSPARWSAADDPRGLACQDLHLRVDCRCTDSQSAVWFDATLAKRFRQHAAQVRLSGCASVSVTTAAAASLRFLVELSFERVGDLIFDRRALSHLPHLRRVLISNCTRVAFSPLSFDSLSGLQAVHMDNSSVAVLPPAAFHNCSIDNLTMEGGALGVVQNGAFDGSVVGELSLIGVTVGAIEPHAFARLTLRRRLTVGSSSVVEAHHDAFAGAVEQRLCLYGNRVPCHCRNPGLTLALSSGNNCQHAQPNVCAAQSDAPAVDALRLLAVDAPLCRYSRADASTASSSAPTSLILLISTSGFAIQLAYRR